MNANIGFGRRIRPPKITEVQHNKTLILFHELSEVGKSANITVGAEPIVLIAFGLVPGQSITVNNVFRNLEEPMYYDGVLIELTPENNVVVLALSGIYNCTTTDILGSIFLIAYGVSSMDEKARQSVALTNPNGPHSNLPNTYFDGSAGQVYSKEVFVGNTPVVFRAYGLDTQTIVLETLFKDQAADVYEEGQIVELSADETTLIISIAGRYRFRMVGDSTNVVLAVNPTDVNFTNPYLKRGNIGPVGPPGLSGAGFIFTQPTPSSTWTINHNLGFNPAVELLTVGGVEFEAQVTHINTNQTVVNIAIPMAGSARLN